MVPPAKTTAPSEKGNDWCPPPSCFNYLHVCTARAAGTAAASVLLVDSTDCPRVFSRRLPRQAPYCCAAAIPVMAIDATPSSLRRGTLLLPAFAEQRARGAICLYAICDGCDCDHHTNTHHPLLSFGVFWGRIFRK